MISTPESIDYCLTCHFIGYLLKVLAIGSRDII